MNDLYTRLLKRYFDIPVNDLLLSETLHPGVHSPFRHTAVEIPVQTLLQ